MTKPFLPRTTLALAACCLLAGVAQAQSIVFSGNTSPGGDLGASYSAGNVDIGNTATGTLEILNGGKLTSGRAIVGGNLGGNGSATVDGPGSSWVITDPFSSGLVIGQGQAPGSLRVRNGATVSSNKQITSSNAPNSVALVEVDGANSVLQTDDRCGFGGSDATTVRISNGGQIRCDGFGSLAFGSVSLTGTGSKWVIGQDLFTALSTDVHSILNIGEGTALEVGGTLNLPNAADDTIINSATLNIEGASPPGLVTAPELAFGSNKGGVINLNHSDASGSYQLATSMSGPGTVNVRNGGTTTLAGNNSYSGTTSIAAGTLRAGATTGFSPASDYVVASGAKMDTATFAPTVGSLRNDGTVTMAAGGTSGSLTVAGNYSSDGGSIELNTALGDSSSATEKLVVNGDTSGNTILNISNLGGSGAATTGEGILVVQVNGASNGTFALPAPGYVQAGTFRYDLVKTGNNWYLVSEARAESSPTASVVCSPAELSDADNQVATCTVSLNLAPAADLSINLAVPAANPRYTTTCTSPMLIAANTSTGTCTITAVANNTADDGDVTAELAVAPPTVADAYTVAGPAAQVLIKDKDKTDNGGGENPENPGGENPGGENPGENGGGTAPHKVPTMGAVGLMSMASILSLLGLRRVRKDRKPV